MAGFLEAEEFEEITKGLIAQLFEPVNCKGKDSTPSATTTPSATRGGAGVGRFF